MARSRRDPSQEILIAKTSGVLVVEGTEQQITKGVSRARAGHPIVKAAPDWWEPIQVHYELEEATAEPGERRG